MCHHIRDLQSVADDHREYEKYSKGPVRINDNQNTWLAASASRLTIGNVSADVDDDSLICIGTLYSVSIAEFCKGRQIVQSIALVHVTRHLWCLISYCTSTLRQCAPFKVEFAINRRIQELWPTLVSTHVLRLWNLCETLQSHSTYSYKTYHGILVTSHVQKHCGTGIARFGERQQRLTMTTRHHFGTFIN